MGTPGDDQITVSGRGYANGGAGNDVLFLHSNAVAGVPFQMSHPNEIHAFGDLGNDTLHLGFEVDAGGVYRAGHHVTADIEGATLAGQYGNDTFNFANINNVGAGSLAVGRLQDFDNSRDIIQIEGVALDLTDPASFNAVPNITVRIVEHNGQLQNMDDGNGTNSEPQQWLLIKNANGGTIFYALEGARASTADTFDAFWSGGSSGLRREERHFLQMQDIHPLVNGNHVTDLPTIIAHLDSLPSVTFIDKQNVVPHNFLPGAGGMFINDDDSAYGQPRNPRPDLSLNVEQPINGSVYDDVIASGLNRDLVNADAGNDTVWGGSGYDTVNGGDGDDSILGGTGNDRLLGDAGNDVVSGEHGNDTLSGGAGNDSVWGGDGDDFVWGEGGNDRVGGGNGNDQAAGGDGNDTIWGGDGNDTMWGGAGGDRLYGQGDNDLMYGEGDADMLSGEGGRDTLHGGDGNDSVWGGDGDDFVWGEGGNDRVGGGNGNDQAAGGDGNDTIWGGNGNDIMWGGAGADRLYGQGDNDTIYGENDADLISGEAGNDRLHGGTGADTVWGGAGNDSVWGEDGNDQVAGGNGNDTVGGGNDNDTIWGGAGSDSLLGGAGNDILYGESGNDTLRGDNGADTLQGGEGRDLLYAGVDNFRDVFVFTSASDSAVGASRDRIYNFGALDVIDLSQIDANLSVTGDQALSYAASASAYSIWHVSSGTSTRIYGDNNGDGVADFEIELVSYASGAVNSGDFIL